MVQLTLLHCMATLTRIIATMRLAGERGGVIDDLVDAAEELGRLSKALPDIDFIPPEQN